MSFGFTASSTFSAQDSIFRVSVGGRRDVAVTVVDDVLVCRADEILEGFLDGLGSMVLLLPSGSEENPVQMLDGRFSAVPDGFSRFRGTEWSVLLCGCVYLSSPTHLFSRRI